MKNFLLSFSCATALITAVFFGAALAQGTPPAAAPGSQSEQDDWPSLADRSVRESFTSSGGLFTIKLPKQLSGFDAITPADAGMNISGSTFHFTFREGTVAISFWDYLDPGFDLKTEKDFADFFAQMKQVPVTRMRAVLVSERPVSLGSYRGRHFVYDLRDGKREILRVYYVNKRAYTLQAVTENKASSAEALITAAYDSFALVSQATIDAERAKTIKSSTPAPLPQIGKRKQTSDAQDDHLKGKVKTVSAEDQDLSGTGASQMRHLSSLNDYDPQGYRLKSIDFGERGDPFQITVYGYIDGNRVSRSTVIQNEADPPMMEAPGPSDRKKSDPRYEYKYLYKYINDKIGEELWIMSNGDRWQRITYQWNGNEMVEARYDENDKINQKYIYTFDDSGNQIAETDVAVLETDTNGDSKYLCKNELFDNAGNWTKRTVSKLAVENGKEVYKPWYITYRTITYYP